MTWQWRSEPPTESLARVFPSQGEAETWLGEFYPDLLDEGVRAVSLYDGDRLVYGPMSLEPESP